MLAKREIITYFDYEIFNGKLNEVFFAGFNNKRALVLNTINPHSFVVATRDSLFKESLQKADFLFADGIGIKFLAYFFLKKKIKLINGPMIHQYIIDSFLQTPLKVIYLGSTDDTLFLIKRKLETIGAKWEVYTYSPPFKVEFSFDENKNMVNFINEIEPNIIFVGMTAPKQEKWVRDNVENLKTSYILSIGAVFDFFSEKKSMGPKFINKFHLIWLYRLIIDFKRIWPRTFISLPKFVFYNIFPKYYQSTFRNKI
jgi:N-acetylglucosaminyldiphosphoundecaprenol N-acetyl-beta-D-mannosaminyltransferase